MNETELKELKDSALVMYLAIDSVSKLHDATEAGHCQHCSALADADVAYPCPTVEILLTDWREVISQSSETAESEEPSA